MSEARTKGVGYKNPPQHSRFKAGQSGNPRGRPKRQRGKVDISEYLLREITVTMSGKQVKMSPSEFLMTMILEGVSKKDRHSMRLLFDAMKYYGVPGDTPPADDGVDPGIEIRRRFELIVKRGEEYEKWNAERLKQGVEPS